MNTETVARLGCEEIAVAQNAAAMQRTIESNPKIASIVYELLRILHTGGPAAETLELLAENCRQHGPRDQIIRARQLLNMIREEFEQWISRTDDARELVQRYPEILTQNETAESPASDPA